MGLNYWCSQNDSEQALLRGVLESCPSTYSVSLHEPCGARPGWLAHQTSHPSGAARMSLQRYREL